MRVRFNVEEMANKLGVSQDELLNSLALLKEALRQQEKMFIQHAKNEGKISQHLALVGLAWLHCEPVSEG